MKVECLEVEGLTFSKMWSDFISKRLPVVINGHPSDPDWKASEKWTVDYLTEVAGECDLVVETRGSGSECFGQGKARSMKMKDFLRELQSGNDNLYLSAQDPDLDRRGFPQLVSPPMTELKKDICLSPSLMGGLVPQQINIWMGCSQSGSSSGLHHDYHDNLYILLRGEKQFSLFPPSDADKMYTYGEIAKIHHNGRIVYKGQGNVLADGSDFEDVQKWRNEKQQDAEDSTDESDLEAILERHYEERDDYSPSDDEIPVRKRRKPNSKAAASYPPNFSRIHSEVGDIQRQFPEFPGYNSAIQCNLEAGQMLYLPAGWFHNVTSKGSAKIREDPIHLAVNFWFYPPDNLSQPLESEFFSPYCSEYWSEISKQK